MISNTAPMTLRIVQTSALPAFEVNHSTRLSDKLKVCRSSLTFFLVNPPTARLCKKFVVRPSGGSLYLGFRLITNFRLKAELRTSCFHTVSQLVDCSYSAYTNVRCAGRRIPPTQSVDCSYSAYTN